jgi:hypothetical protein
MTETSPSIETGTWTGDGVEAIVAPNSSIARASRTAAPFSGGDGVTRYWATTRSAWRGGGTGGDRLASVSQVPSQFPAVGIAVVERPPDAGLGRAARGRPHRSESLEAASQSEHKRGRGMVFGKGREVPLAVATLSEVC